MGSTKRANGEGEFEAVFYRLDEAILSRRLQELCHSPGFNTFPAFLTSIDAIVDQCTITITITVVFTSIYALYLDPTSFHVNVKILDSLLNILLVFVM